MSVLTVNPAPIPVAPLPMAVPVPVPSTASSSSSSSSSSEAPVPAPASSGLVDVPLPSVYNATTQPVQQVHAPTLEGTSVPMHVINIPGPGAQLGTTEPGAAPQEGTTKDEAIQTTSPSTGSRVLEAINNGFNKVVDVAEIPVEYARQASSFLGNGILDIWDETIHTFKHGFNPKQDNNDVTATATITTAATQPGARTDPLAMEIEPPVLTEITTDAPPTATNSQTAYAGTPAFVIEDTNQGVDTTSADIPIPSSTAVPQPVV